jgi:hypothetical protein
MIDTSLMGYGKVLLMEGKQEILNLIKAGYSTEALKERLEAELEAAESKPQTRVSRS